MSTPTPHRPFWVRGVDQRTAAKLSVLWLLVSAVLTVVVTRSFNAPSWLEFALACYALFAASSVLSWFYWRRHS